MMSVIGPTSSVAIRRRGQRMCPSTLRNGWARESTEEAIKWVIPMILECTTDTITHCCCQSFSSCWWKCNIEVCKHCWIKSDVWRGCCWYVVPAGSVTVPWRQSAVSQPCEQRWLNSLLILHCHQDRADKLNMFQESKAPALLVRTMKSITLTTHLFTQYLHLAFRKLLALHQTCYPSIKFFQRRSIFWHISVLLYCCTCNYNEINKMLQLTFKMSNFKLNSGLSQIKCKKIQKMKQTAIEYLMYMKIII